MTALVGFTNHQWSTTNSTATVANNYTGTTTNAKTTTVPQYCASSPDKFYMLTSSSQIVAAFNSIGTSLSQLRVAR